MEYSKIRDNYIKLGVQTFDFVNFSKYTKDAETLNFLREINIVDDSEFLLQICRVLHQSSEPPVDVIRFVINESKPETLSLYYKMFSQVSLLLDSYFSTNLTSPLIAESITENITENVIENLNDIELHCFFIRYGDSKTLLSKIKKSLGKETFTKVNVRLNKH